MKGRGMRFVPAEKNCGGCYYFQPTGEDTGVCVCKRSEVYQRSVIHRGIVPPRKRADKPCAAWRDVLSFRDEVLRRDELQGPSL